MPIICGRKQQFIISPIVKGWILRIYEDGSKKKSNAELFGVGQRSGSPWGILVCFIFSMNGECRTLRCRAEAHMMAVLDKASSSYLLYHEPFAGYAAKSCGCSRNWRKTEKDHVRDRVRERGSTFSCFHFIWSTFFLVFFSLSRLQYIFVLRNIAIYHGDCDDMHVVYADWIYM